LNKSDEDTMTLYRQNKKNTTLTRKPNYMKEKQIENQIRLENEILFRVRAKDSRRLKRLINKL